MAEMAESGLRERLIEHYRRTVREICRMLSATNIDDDVRESVIYRVNSLRHLLVRCEGVTNVPNEVNHCLETVVNLLCHDSQGHCLSEGHAGYQARKCLHKTGEDPLTAYQRNS